MEEMTTVSLTGSMNSGKTTVGSAIIREVMPTGYEETTSCSVYPIVDPVKYEQRVFTRIDNTGRSEDFPIEQLLKTMDDDTAEKLIFYISKSSILERVRIVDIAGSDSPLKHSHNRRAAEFVKSMSSDIIVTVVADTQGLHRIFTVAEGSNDVLPYPRIIVVNKIDEKLKWEADVRPESVIKETIHRTKANLADLIGESDIVLNVHCCSAIAGLAGQVWGNEILEMMLRLAETGNLALLSAGHFFNTEINGVPSTDERKAISVSANRPLIGPWRASDAAYQPAFPAIRYAVALAMTEGLKTADTLRERLIDSSGVREIRASLLSLTSDEVIAPALAWRRRMIRKAEKLDVKIHKLKRDQSETRIMCEHVHQLALKIDTPLGNTEFSQRCDALKTYLYGYQKQLALNLRTVSAQVAGLREHYLEQLLPKRIKTPTQ